MEGSGRIKPSKNELKMRVARKSIFAKIKIKKGENFQSKILNVEDQEMVWEHKIILKFWAKSIKIL